MNLPRRPRCGFTLVELLAGMALTTLLMLAIFQVLASVARQGRAMASQESATAQPWKEDLVDSVRWDLMNAESVSVEGDRLIVRGHGALDRVTLSPRHVPAEVSYFVRRIAARDWLVRRQKTANASAWTAFVCSDVTSFVVSEAGEGEPVASGYLLRVECSDGTTIEETIVLR